MKKVLFTVIGAVLGLPLSYYFQPEGVRAKLGMSGYLEHFDEILDSKDLIGNVIISVIIFAIIGFIIGYFMDKEKKTSDNINDIKPEKKKVDYENINKRAGAILSSLLAFFLLNLKKTKQWIMSNPKIMGILGVLFLLGAIIFFVFIKNYPSQDGNKLAIKICKCYKIYNKEIIDTYSNFSNDFDNTKYKQRSEARSALQNLINPINSRKYKCIENINKEYQLVERKYDNDYKGQKKLELSFNNNQGACSTIGSDKENTLYSEINNKIETIKDPEPDKEKIKGDLIGNKIPGWNFDYLSEFKQFTILNTIKNNNRIEYDIKMELLDETSGSTHDCEIKVTYNLGGNGWYFNNVKMKYITYINTFYADKWVKINPLKNCRWNVTDDYKLEWKTYKYGTSIISGPDAKNVSLPNSSVYFIKSREGRDIDIKFTYRPN